MPKKFKTSKGMREFDDKLTRAEIEAQLINEGVTEYEEAKPHLKSIGEINPQKLRSMFGAPSQIATRAVFDEPLDFTNAAASFARPMASRAAAGAIMSRIPHPVARILGGILGYTATDQIAQQAQKSILGQRPQGILEQTLEPGNEAVRRLMGTAENAALDWGAGKIIDFGANAIKGGFNKVKQATIKPEHVSKPMGGLEGLEDLPPFTPMSPTPSPVDPKLEELLSNVKRWTTPKNSASGGIPPTLPPLWEMPIKPTVLKNGVWHEDPMTPRIFRSLEEELIRRGVITQSDIAPLRDSAMNALEKEGKLGQRFSEFYAQTLQNYLSKPVRSNPSDLGANAVKGLFNKVKPIAPEPPATKLVPASESKIIVPEDGGKGFKTPAPENASSTNLFNLPGSRHPTALVEEFAMTRAGAYPSKAITRQDELIANINRLTTPRGASALDDNMPALSQIYDELKNTNSHGKAFKVGDVDVIVPSIGVRGLEGVNSAYAPPGMRDPIVGAVGLKYLGKRDDFVILSHVPKDAAEFLDLVSEELTHRQHWKLSADRMIPPTASNMLGGILDKIPGYRKPMSMQGPGISQSVEKQFKEGVAKSIAGNALPIPERETFKAGMEKAFTIDELKTLRKYQSYGIGGVAAALGNEEERKAKLKTSVGLIPEFEQAIQDPKALERMSLFEDGKKTKEDLRAYWIQSRLQSRNATAALSEPAAAALYTPNERKELGAFFKAVDEKKLPPDIQLTPKGVQISGPMASEAGLGGYMLAIGLGEFARRILLRQGTRAAAKAIADYAAGNASKIPARKMGKYFLRNALRGADVLLQTADGEKEITVE